MGKKSSKLNKRKTSAFRSLPWKSIFLTLTLVPIIIGLLLILAWALDMEILESQSEVQVGLFFILLGFALSNALQKRSSLAIGWGVLAIADLVVLTWRSVWAQGVALAIGLIGIIFLGIQFYKQYQQDKMEIKK
ncbi:MAG: hypothetical protein ISR59_01160 [Anaerolineales bacterium]|uniref:Uncharacterized protein n=1 Tax=Candidatus Desulfolinea nitratireducens TaxID=2841698 RepID=A0A8J6NRN4_9CHLR|nr:hypothetical protein [Candidatus Desulfolinea nitratireducens]MBL6959687.1 hypothetical protein [Anaerolineales bacterium]